MKLEEAKQILNCLLGRCKKCDEEYCDGCYIDNEDIEAIETKLQEIEHLQKENEELKGRNKILESCKYVDSYEIIKAKQEESERWKDKIREKIEELNKKEKEELKGTNGSDRHHIKLEYMYKKNILQDLLKEE